MGQKPRRFFVPPASGLLLTDSSLKPLYANKEAVRVLIYPKDPGKISNVDRIVEEKAHSLIASLRTDSPSSSLFREFVSGRRVYHCRAVTMDPDPHRPLQPALALLLERRQAGCVNFAPIGDHYRLAPREREALGWLALGLTGKEIAARMKISPNTVKTLLHLVMIKMDVSTRTAVMAKLIASPGEDVRTARGSSHDGDSASEPERPSRWRQP